MAADKRQDKVATRQKSPQQSADEEEGVHTLRMKKPKKRLSLNGSPEVKIQGPGGGQNPLSAKSKPEMDESRKAGLGQFCGCVRGLRERVPRPLVSGLLGIFARRGLADPLTSSRMRSCEKLPQ